MSRSASGESNDGKEDREEAAAEKLGGKVTLGDLIWVKVGKGTWWPAQVVDENTVSERNKPRNQSAGEVLVRLYGSYQYLYMDPIRCHSQFKIVLEQNNENYHEIFDKALNQEVQSMKSGRSKSQGSKSTGKSSKKQKVLKKPKPEKEGKKGKRKKQTKDVAETPKTKTPKKKKTVKNDELENLQSELSGRRMRVMQSLGLIAPSGSPF